MKGVAAAGAPITVRAPGIPIPAASIRSVTPLLATTPPVQDINAGEADFEHEPDEKVPEAPMLRRVKFVRFDENVRLRGLDMRNYFRAPQVDDKTGALVPLDDVHMTLDEGTSILRIAMPLSTFDCGIAKSDTASAHANWLSRRAQTEVSLWAIRLRGRASRFVASVGVRLRGQAPSEKPSAGNLSCRRP